MNEKERESAESFLIGRFAEDVGARVDIPSDAEDRWRLLRSLMNVRPPMEDDPEILSVQDAYLSDIIAGRGITNADSLQYRGGMCVWRGDITSLRCDAIVNAANSAMLGCFSPCHGCIDNTIHTYAGVQLRAECARIMDGAKEPTGHARITGAYNLPCGHVIHTVGPIVDGEPTPEDRRDLGSCYESCMDLAASHGLRTVAFCCISTGVYGFPQREAAEIAVSTVKRRLEEHPDMRVVFDVFTDRDEMIYHDLLGRCHWNLGGMGLRR